MIGVISTTDWEWFQFLRRQPELEEVNFWRPLDTRQLHLNPGAPFLFKLNERYGGAIVGYGFFSTHSIKPMWRAWEVLEQVNGAPTMGRFYEQLATIRTKHNRPTDPAGNFLIGCIMLSAPVFLEESVWIRPPSDWPRSGPKEKRYDLLSGEGARVWSECLAATPVVRGVVLSAGEVADAPRFGAPVLVKPRLGQGAFRFAVTDAYGGACAVTSEHSLPVLEAAHIRPYAEKGPHEVGNGLLLRTDVHKLFDKGYVTVDPDDHRFVVSRRLKDDYQNGRAYYEMHGKIIQLPREVASYPSREYLEWHAAERFRG